MEDRFDPIVDDSKYGYVYRITHMETGKTYIGMHKIRPGEKWISYMGSGTVLKKAVKKHGAEAFTKELLGYSESFESLKLLESKFITQEREMGKAEYNLYECERGSKNYFKQLDIDDNELLSLYFEEKLSLHEIVSYYEHLFTVGQLTTYLKSLPRFNAMREESGTFTFKDQVYRDPETGESRTRRVAIARTIPTTCPECKIQISKSQLWRHRSSATCKDNQRYENGIRTCAYDGCERTLTKIGATFCIQHAHQDSSFKQTVAKNLEGIDRKKVGSLGVHKRHHVNKDICVEFCDYCVSSGSPLTITKMAVYSDMKQGISIAEMSKKYNVATSTIYRWREEYRSSLDL